MLLFFVFFLFFSFIKKTLRVKKKNTPGTLSSLIIDLDFLSFFGGGGGGGLVSVRASYSRICVLCLYCIILMNGLDVLIFIFTG